MNTFYLIKPYFIKNRVSIALGLLCLMVVDLLQLFIPRIIKLAVDDLAALKAEVIDLMWYALVIVGITLFITVLRYFWRIFLMGMSRELEQGLRNRLFSHIQTLSASYFNKVKSGDLMAHATNDIHHIRMASGMGMVAIMSAAVLGITTIGFMAYINVRLTFFVLIPMPGIIFCTRFFSKQMLKTYMEVQKSFSDLTEIVRERFTGIRIIKSYNRESESVSVMEKISLFNMKKNLKLVRITGIFFPMMVFFSNVSLSVVLYLGGRQTITGIISPGDFVAFISYIGMLTWPMMALGWVVNLIQRGKASLERIHRIVETMPEISDVPGAKEIKGLKKGISFDNICFSYDKKGQEIIKDFSLKLEQGKTLGIIGPPGSGKTALLNLIPRIFDVTGGSILIDGIDIRQLKTADLRDMISFVPQEPFLFAGTVQENITFNNPDISGDLLIDAAKKACVYDTIMSFPKGFETIVGEKGVILSGGQKQRIALARAFLKQSSVAIFDDPISQVDVETGTAIVNTINTMTQDKTIVIVSHRLSAVRFADHIITIKDGKIAESGSHNELMAKQGYYAKTFQMQEIEEEINAV